MVVVVLSFLAICRLGSLNESVQKMLIIYFNNLCTSKRPLYTAQSIIVVLTCKVVVDSNLQVRVVFSKSL